MAVLILTFAAVASAQDHFTVFVSDLGYVYSTASTSEVVNGTAVPVNHSRSELSGGLGLAYSHAWNSRWSTQAAVAFERHYMLTTKFTPVTVNGLVFFAPVTSREPVDTFPVDLLTRYSFTNSSRWTPHLGAGLRYVNAPDVTVQGPFPPTSIAGGAPITLQRPSNRLSAQVEVGTLFRLTKTVGLEFDLKRLVRSDSAPYDPLTRGSFGVNWKF